MFYWGHLCRFYDDIVPLLFRQKRGCNSSWDISRRTSELVAVSCGVVAHQKPILYRSKEASTIDCCFEHGCKSQHLHLFANRCTNHVESHIWFINFYISFSLYSSRSRSSSVCDRTRHRGKMARLENVNHTEFKKDPGATYPSDGYLHFLRTMILMDISKPSIGV